MLRPCKLYSFQHVTSEFCDEWILQQLTSEYYNEWQEDFTTSNEWILKGVNFVLSSNQSEFHYKQQTIIEKLCLQKSKSIKLKSDKIT